LQLLAISGSLREASTNTRLIRAAPALAPAGATVLVYEGLGSLPPFNPDVEQGAALPSEPLALRKLVAGSSGLVISSPEYAHGVPGTLKNALDWLVGSLEFAGMPVALWNLSPRSVHARAQLREVLATMAAVFPEGADIDLSTEQAADGWVDGEPTGSVAAAVRRSLSTLIAGLGSDARRR
jgi:NAD(P)H-dependent FMN reductase